MGDGTADPIAADPSESSVRNIKDRKKIQFSIENNGIEFDINCVLLKGPPYIFEFEERQKHWWLSYLLKA